MIVVIVYLQLQVMGPKREVKETNTFQPSPDMPEGPTLCNFQAQKNILNKPAAPHPAQAPCPSKLLQTENWVLEGCARPMQ